MVTQIAASIPRVGRWARLAALSILLPVSGCDVPSAEPVRPNVLVIVADDLGWSDIGALGGEIPTPNLDALVEDGMLFTNFHVAATCSPTRAMLLTGVDNHRAGLGNMGEFLADAQRGQPGYEGYLNHRVATLATRLREAGYATGMAGKWHLGGAPDQRPHARGFDRSFALLEGAGSAWSDVSPAPSVGERVRFTRDGDVVPRPEGFAATLYVDELIAFLEETPEDRPFFAYLAFQAVHWPHHAPERFLEAARGRYDAGWRAARDGRLARQRSLGLLPADTPASPMEEALPDWDTLSGARQRDEAARMEAYAAMAMAMDFEVGRLLDHLRAGGRLDDTLVLFVSDNGADPSQPERSAMGRQWYEQHYPKRDPADLGSAGSFPSIGFAWARVGVTPLAGHKGDPGEGGLRVPLVAHWPGQVPAGRRSDAFGYVTDLAPTVLEAVGVPPASSAGALAMDGRSLWPVAAGRHQRAHPPEESVGYELMGNAALYRGDWKLVRRHGGPWQLFDLARDPGETRDLAGEDPDGLAELLGAYARYESSMGVVPVPPDYDVMEQLLRSRDRDR